MVRAEVFFFFSSRRRHTRYWRDWSSDVCSSDLLDREQMLGRHIWDFVSPGEQSASRRAVMRKLTAEEPLLVFERGYERPDGGSLVLEIHERYRRDEHGKIAGIRSFLHDITARKR